MSGVDLGNMAALKAVGIGLGTAAVAAGLAAVMNLKPSTDAQIEKQIEQEYQRTTNNVEDEQEDE